MISIKYLCITKKEVRIIKMFNWFKDKTELQKLKDKYSKLMKISYRLAVKDKEKSDKVHQEADKLLLRIKKLEQVNQI